MLIPNALYCGPYYNDACDKMNELIHEFPDILLYTHGGDVDSHFVLKSDLPQHILERLQEIDHAADEEWRREFPP